MALGLRLTVGALALALATPAAAGGYYSGAHYAESSASYEYERYEEGRYERREERPRCDPRRPYHPDDPYACPPGWGEVRLDDSFFADAGGVGPAWIAGGGGGGGGGAYAVAGSSASAFASASASASVSIRFRGGFKGRHGGHKRRGGKGGCGC